MSFKRTLNRQLGCDLRLSSIAYLPLFAFGFCNKLAVPTWCSIPAWLPCGRMKPDAVTPPTLFVEVGAASIKSLPCEVTFTDVSCCC